jgi:hypothetical protein
LAQGRVHPFGVFASVPGRRRRVAGVSRRRVQWPHLLLRGFGASRLRCLARGSHVLRFCCQRGGMAV